jgi:hypothetical protein
MAVTLVPWECSKHLVLRATLVINGIERNNVLQEPMNLWMAAGISSCFKQWHKQIIQKLLKVLDLLLTLEDAVQSGHLLEQSPLFIMKTNKWSSQNTIIKTQYLNDPANIVRKQVVINNPLGNLVPLIVCLAVH